MATHSSILAWRIPMDRGLQPIGSQESDLATEHARTCSNIKRQTNPALSLPDVLSCPLRVPVPEAVSSAPSPSACIHASGDGRGECALSEAGNQAGGAG